jgi:hypothetical protein
MLLWKPAIYQFLLDSRGSDLTGREATANGSLSSVGATVAAKLKNGC